MLFLIKVISPEKINIKISLMIAFAVQLLWQPFYHKNK